MTLAGADWTHAHEAVSFMITEGHRATHIIVGEDEWTLCGHYARHGVTLSESDKVTCGNCRYSLGLRINEEQKQFDLAISKLKAAR